MEISGGICGDKWRDMWRQVEGYVEINGGICGDKWRDMWR